MTTLTEPTAYDIWVSQDPARGSGEIDFETCWTSTFAPGEHRVSYLEGTGELIVVDDRDEVRVLGRYRDLYRAEDAVGAWSTEANKPGSLDRLLGRFPDHHHLVTVHEPDGRAVFGLVVDVNGDRERIYEPLTDETLRVPFGEEISGLHALPIRVGDRGLVLFAEQHGIGRIVNPMATLLAGHGHPILGRAIVGDLSQPLDPSLIDSLDPPRSVHQEWVARDFTRQQPEVDYGTTWTSNTDLDETWRVSWNPGSGELYRLNDTDTALQVLGVYPDRAAVETVLEGWGSLARKPGGLDQLPGMPEVAELRFVDRIDQLEQRLAFHDGPDPSIERDPIATVDPEPDLNDEMDIS